MFSNYNNLINLRLRVSFNFTVSLKIKVENFEKGGYFKQGSGVMHFFSCQYRMFATRVISIVITSCWASSAFRRNLRKLFLTYARNRSNTLLTKSVSQGFWYSFKLQLWPASFFILFSMHRAVELLQLYFGKKSQLLWCSCWFLELNINHNTYFAQLKKSSFYFDHLSNLWNFLLMRKN